MNAVQNVIWMCFKHTVILHTFQIIGYKLFLNLCFADINRTGGCLMANGGCCINVKGEDVVDCVFSVSSLTLILHHTHCSD